MNIKYFTCANSCNGFVNLTESNVHNLSKRFVLSCSSNNVVSEFIERVGEYFEKKGHNVEYILSPFDEKKFEGCIVRLLDFCLLSEKICNDKGIIVELGKDESLVPFEREVKGCMEKMYASFKEAKEIHDQWEKLYIDNMDFERLDTFKKGTIKEMFGERRIMRTPNSFERFFGASAKNGYVNLINELTENIKKRYFIKGRPGTGKSTFMKEVAINASQRGFDTEIYRCSFDPNSLDMVMIKDADLCVFDSTSPHEMFPEREGDVILDFYKESGLEGTDEKFKGELEEISKKYKDKIKEGSEHLRFASISEEELETKAIELVNFTTVENMFKMLIAEIEKGL